jgi:hypothetical protein
MKAIEPGPPRPRSPWRAILLSGLVFPGLGQLLGGHPLRGLVFAAGTVAAAALLIQRVVREALERLPTDPAEIDVGWPFRLAHEIQRENGEFLLWITIVLLALWAGSVFDAWLTRSRR